MYQVGINDRKGMDTLFMVSEEIKDIISSIDIECFNSILISHYKTLMLIDSSGKWMTEKLNNLSAVLIPKDIQSDSLAIFIDEITMLCTRNNYLMNFFRECNNRKFKNLQMKFHEEGKKVIIDVVIYAYMLEILSKECAKNYIILEELYNCFSVNRNRRKSFKELPLACKLELVSVENFIRSYLKCHKKKMLRANFGNIAISKSILEFMCVDLLYGEVGNMQAGFVLAKNRCGLTIIDESTGAGPSIWSKDEKMIEHVFPLSESWNNLYQVWNMCSAINLKDFPYKISSLLIPQVSNYYRNPYKYLYNVNIALYISLNFLSLNYSDKKGSGENIIDWKDSELRKVFSNSNKKAAKIYNEKLKKTRY